MSSPVRAFPTRALPTKAEALQRAAAAFRELAGALDDLAMHQGPALSQAQGPELSIDQALAYFPGRSRRWLMEHTKGKSFRHDHTQRVKTFEARGFHRWRQGVNR